MMTRQSRFAFACARCGRCCQDKAIQLNGYEIARLARGLGSSISDFIAQHTTEAGQFLRFKDDGACAFLRPEGCAVHADRPLACRLYPLGREEGGGGEELFVGLEAHPLCAGRAGQAEAQSVADFLAGQGTEPFLRAFDLYQRAALRFLGLPAAARRQVAPELVWFDQDLALAQDGLTTLPGDPWRKLLLHLSWLGRVMDQAGG